MGRWTALRGALAGVLAGACALGVGQLVAGITGASSSPVVEVGQLQIDHTPPWLKNFAINEFGSNDKTALVIGILIVLALFAAVAGILAARRLWYGMAGLLVFAVVGLTAAATRPKASFSTLLPTLFAVATAAIVLRLLAQRADSPPESEQRRQFLIASVGTVVVAGLADLIGRGLIERASVSSFRTALKLPKPTVTVPALPAGVNLPVPGITPFVTSDNSFYRVDTAIVLPQVDPSTWQLRIHGMVNREMVLTFDDLIRRPLIEDWITLCCVSNPVAGPYIGNALWLGASLGSLLRECGIKAGADQLFCTSVDGFTVGTPVATAMDGRDALLAVSMNNQALPVAHGFPVRMVVPGLYGYVSATKWVTDIEVTTFAANAAYWVPQGWSQQAPIKTESRIDVPTGSSPLPTGKMTSVAGVAWAQHKGIAAVEVRVDKGPWNEARLAAVPGIDCWRQWVYDWTPAASGTHLIESRATDETGYTQTSLAEPPEPNGASGYPMVQVTVQLPGIQGYPDTRLPGYKKGGFVHANGVSGQGRNSGTGKASQMQEELQPRPRVDARQLWAGGAATAVVAALIALVGILICRWLFTIPILAPRQDGAWGDASTGEYMLVAAAVAVVATALMYLLAVATPKPTAFFGWIMGLITVVAAVFPFSTTAPLSQKAATALVNLVLGIAIMSLISGVAARSTRYAIPAGTTREPLDHPVREYTDRPDRDYPDRPVQESPARPIYTPDDQNW